MTAKSNYYTDPRFWSVVQWSLQEFHNYAPRVAGATVRDYEKKIRLSMHDPTLVYHDEPFYVANALAGQEITLSDNREKYADLMDRARKIKSSTSPQRLWMHNAPRTQRQIRPMDNAWVVTMPNGRILGRFPTQAAAIDYAKNTINHSAAAELVIHGKDGRIREATRTFQK